jgi:uncharacterized membrane protein YbhN (UPF0104 family)/tRNA A-37 threonylcarbamoyl transferase component Bud32
VGVAAAGVVVLALLAVAAPGPTDVDTKVAKAIATFPGLLTWLWESVYAAALLWALVLVLAALATRHRRVLVLEQLGAVVLALGVGGLVAVLEGSSWNQVWAALATQDGSTLYPAVRLTVVVAVVAVTAPHLARPHRRLGTAIALLGAASALILAVDTVLGLVAGLVLGVTVAAVVHLVAGSPGGHVPLEQLRAQLVDLGVELSDLRYVDEPGHLSVVVRASDGDGHPVLVRIYGRDAWEASLLANVWQRLWYRQPTASSVGRQERTEHEAYLTMVAERARVPVQPVLAAGTAWGRDAMLVRRDDGVPLPDAGADAYAEPRARASWRTLDLLHGAGLAHGDLRSRSLSLDAEGVVRLTDLASAIQGVAATEQAADRAHLLVISALRLGIDDAVRVARDVVGDDALVAAMPYLQPAAFDADTRREIKSATWRIGALRDAITAGTGVEAQPLEKLRRVSLSSIAMLVVLVVVAYVIIGAIAGVGLDTLIEQFQGASWWWVGAAVLLAVLIYVGQAFAVQGANVDPLPFVPVLGLETSVAFVGLAVPASAAKIGLTIRFLQLVGSNPTAAVTISVIDSLSGFVVQVLVVVLTLFTGLVTLTPTTTDGTGIGSTLANIDWATVGIVCLVLLVVAVLVIRFVPKARAFVRDRTAEGRDSLRVLRSPRKLARLAFGSVMWNVVAALVLGCSLNAFGHSASFASLILVNTLVALFSGLMPVPGNVGVAEAAITAGLVAIGIPQAVAMSTAIVYRIATYVAPAIYGYVSLTLMRRRGYL